MLARDITFWSMSTLIKTLKKCTETSNKNFLQKSRGSRDDEAIKSTETRIDDEAIKCTETRMHYM